MKHALSLSLRRAFTLVEVLVVISIFVLLLAIAVPAFSSMLYTSEQSLAENSLRLALGAARDVAAKSPTGQDSAAVFMYDPESKKTTTLIVTKVGVLNDRIFNGGQEGNNNASVTREVFAAAPGIEPIQMTAGWTVRGYAPAGFIDDEWYEQAGYQNLRTQGNWVFPETEFYLDSDPQSHGQRQTFMIRFEGGTGQVLPVDPSGVLVFSESPSSANRNTPIVGGNPSTNPLNPENEPDPVRFVRKILAWPTTGTLALPSSSPRHHIVGQYSRDVILAKAVGQVALCSERRLARGLQLEVDKFTGCLYQQPSASGPAFVTAVTDADLINQWIENTLPDGNGGVVDSDCRIFCVQKYLGWLQEVTGTRNGQGVGS